MGDFQYFPYIIVIILVLFTVLIGVTYFLTTPLKDTYWFGVGHGKAFDTSTLCSFPNWSPLLAATRILSALFFVVFLVLLLVMGYKRNMWVFFSTWNIFLTTFYFVLASSASLMRLLDKKSERVGAVVAMLYIIAAPTSFFCTFTDLVFIDAVFSYWYLSAHLLSAVALIVEIFLNSFPVMWRNVPAYFAWSAVYLCVIWGLRAEFVANDWPNAYMSTSNPMCFVWYAVFAILCCVFYSIFWVLSHIKYRCILNNRVRQVCSEHLTRILEEYDSDSDK